MSHQDRNQAQTVGRRTARKDNPAKQHCRPPQQPGKAHCPHPYEPGQHAVQPRQQQARIPRQQDQRQNPLLNRHQHPPP